MILLADAVADVIGNGDGEYEGKGSEVVLRELTPSGEEDEDVWKVEVALIELILSGGADEDEDEENDVEDDTGVVDPLAVSVGGCEGGGIERIETVDDAF